MAEYGDFRTHLERLEEIMRAGVRGLRDRTRRVRRRTNHVHLLVNFPPKVALSRLVNSLKGVSSRRLRWEFPELARHYYRANKLWSGSYFARSVGGAPVSVLRQYIEQQNRPARAGRRPIAQKAIRLALPCSAGRSASPPA